MKRALAEAEAPSGPKALSRRQFLKMTAASATLAGCGTLVEMGSKSVAVVGGGIAGLTIAACRRPATRSPSTGRQPLGRRMFTKRNFNADGQFCTSSAASLSTGRELIALAKSLASASSA
ncbi:MAG: hypothetical protein U1E87_08690 [Alphaproteobacteria bacterium]